MKSARTIVVLTALGVAASAQSKPNPPAAEQRFFNLEDAVQNPVDLSAAELAALVDDDLMHKELGSAPAGSALTQDGLEAGAVHLCSSGERDLVIMGNGAPFIGANVGPFWIIRDLPAGPQVVLSEISLGLTIQTKRSNQCLNLEAVGSTATQSTTTDFSFNGEKYVVTKQKSTKLP